MIFIYVRKSDSKGPIVLLHVAFRKQGSAVTLLLMGLIIEIQEKFVCVKLFSNPTRNDFHILRVIDLFSSHLEIKFSSVDLLGRNLFIQYFFKVYVVW